MTREEAIKILADLTDNLFLHTWEEQYKALHMAIEALSADAVQVVRCKDCRFWKNKYLCLVMSRYGSIGTKAEHYCSWGERRKP